MPSLSEGNLDLKIGYLMWLYIPFDFAALCKALNFAKAKRTDVPSARFTARNSTFRSANRMLRTLRHEDSVIFRETRNRWFIRIKKS